MASAQTAIRATSSFVGGFVGTTISTGNVGMGLLGGAVGASVSLMNDLSPGVASTTMGLAITGVAAAAGTLYTGSPGAAVQGVMAAGGAGYTSAIASQNETTTTGRILSYSAGSLVGGVIGGAASTVANSARGGRGILGFVAGAAGSLAASVTNAAGQGVAHLVCRR